MNQDSGPPPHDPAAGVYHAALVYAHRRLEPLVSGWSPRLRTALGLALTLPLSMLGWIPFRAESLGDALRMMSRVLDPRAYFSLGLRENNYLVAVLTLLVMFAAYAADRWLLPALEGHPALFVAARTAGYAVMIALVFVFLRPISQFIYFQF